MLGRIITHLLDLIGHSDPPALVDSAYWCGRLMWLWAVGCIGLLGLAVLLGWMGRRKR